MAVVTDRRIVRETVDKKSTLYNHRPPSFVSHDLITNGDHLLVMHYGNQWRTFRKLVHQHLTDSMVENEHLPIVDAEAVQLVRDYMLYPEDHMLHPKRFSNSISNSISGYTFVPYPLKNLLIYFLGSLRHPHAQHQGRIHEPTL